MDSKDFQKSIDFILEADKLKNIFRRSKIIGMERFENDAEHSWHICLMAHTLYPFFETPEKAIDVSRAVKMLIIHDIVEIYAGDTYCYDANAGADKLERETEAADKIFGLLPAPMCQEYKQLWQEFDREETDDAVFASIMDKIQPLLLNYSNNGKPWIDNGISRSQVMKRMDIAINKSNPLVREFVLGIIEDAVLKGYLTDD